MYYRGAQAAIVVYDITNQDTFGRAKTWVKELQRQASPTIVIALAGNKQDLANKRMVEFEEAQTYADENGLLFMETSAKTAMNVNDIFLAIGKDELCLKIALIRSLVSILHWCPILYVRVNKDPMWRVKTSDGQARLGSFKKKNFHGAWNRYSGFFIIFFLFCGGGSGFQDVLQCRGQHSLPATLASPYQKPPALPLQPPRNVVIQIVICLQWSKRETELIFGYSFRK